MHQNSAIDKTPPRLDNKCAPIQLDHFVDINQLVLKREKCVAGFSDICLQSAHHPLGAGRCDWKEEPGANGAAGVDDGENGSTCCDCGLGVQRDTGRLRWCAGNRWIRLLIVIPAALLPLLGLLVLLSSVGAVGAGDGLGTRTVSGSMRSRDSCTAVRYGIAEHLDAEERDVLSDLRTSFIPPESVVVPPNCVGSRRSARSKRRSYNHENCHHHERRSRFSGNISSDIMIWANSSDDNNPLFILHKVSNFTLENEEEEPVKRSIYKKSATVNDDGKLGDYTEEIEGSGDADVNVPISKKAGDDILSLPWKIISMGPHYRPIEEDDTDNRQVDIEETKLSEPAVTTHPPIVHAFWRGQGSRESIRRAQAEAMKQYIDPTIDPCKDFYQHACGNWARVNPIPADKAGYDTFEMLRESLDVVLKELLTRSPSKMATEVPREEFSKATTEDNRLHARHVVNRNHHHFKTNSKLRHKHHPRKHQKDIETPEFYDDDSIDGGSKLLDRTRRSIINILRRYRQKDTKREIPKKYKVAQGLFNLRQIRLIRRIRSALSNDQYRKSKRNQNKPLLSEEDKSRKFMKNMELDQIFEVYTDGAPAASITQQKLIRDYNYANYDDEEDFSIFTTTTNKPAKHKNITGQQTSVDEPILEPLSKEMNGNKSKTHNECEEDATAKARDLFESCMNYDILEKRGNTPLLDLLEDLGGWPAIKCDWNEETFDWLELTARLRLYNNDVLIAEWVGPDIKNSDEYVIQFDQTSLGLPTRDYFLQLSNLLYLNAYKEYMVTITTLLGADPVNATIIANDLINFETKLAKITTAPEDRRNISVLYQRLTIGRLRQIIPQIDWMRYLNIVLGRPINSSETVVMFALSYMQDLVGLLGKTDSRTISNYLMWRFVRHRVNNLDDRFQPAKQKFYYVLFGREQSPPRWKNCVSQVNSNMGMALGALFVKKYFDENSKKDTITMTSDIQQSFRELLNTTNWIDNETKHLAALKVDAMLLRIGYPDYILDHQILNDKYKDVVVHKDKYFENTLDILQHLTRTEQSRLGQLVNKTLWHTAPAVVNAYYSRNKNQIMFPAGILQPPFYHRYFPRSLNYGGIGVVIGHELTHGFDDKGRLFDRDGNLHRWWSDQSIAGFHERAQCLIDQYSNYTVPEVGMSIDGVNTQGENIADNGGIKQAFLAYEHWLEQHGDTDETLPGLNVTNTQLFFLNFAQVWCGAMRPEATRNKLKTAVHSPGKFRVIGTLSNSEDFAREYGCPRGSPMNPIEKCSVW